MYLEDGEIVQFGGFFLSIFCRQKTDVNTDVLIWQR